MTRLDAAQWPFAEALFHAAADLGSDARAALLQAARADDPMLADIVAQMLEADGHGQPLLDAAVAEVAAATLAPSTVPRRIGRYRIMAILGEGGMGVVYKAERLDVGGVVALKVLRDAWLSPAARDRFLLEQRTLAQLHHPSIAALFDADTLEDGTPWFAMEYVAGRPLTTFCREGGLDVGGRLALFREVCAAAQHAHQHLVVHRDLKPSNILVTANRMVKLLDFGIAKQLGEAPAAAFRTVTGLRALTPAYASPEQLRGEPIGVDSDVYSLGVLLYEILTDRLPFNLEHRTSREALALLLEQRPTRPSSAAPASMHRAGRISRAAWADLDVLCLTGMHPDRQRRYRSVEAFMRDIDHFLRGQPLEARPDTLAYRASMFVRRNRLPLSIATSALACVAGVATYYTARLRNSRNAAIFESARAQRIVRFMLNLFQGGDPEAGPSHALQVTELLERGVAEADALASDAGAQAELYYTLGRIYRQLGDFGQADQLLQRALNAARRHLGNASSEAARTRLALADLRIDQAQYDEADALARTVLASAGTLGLQPLLTGLAMRVLGRVLEERGNYDQAGTLLVRAVHSLEPLGETVDLADAVHELANVRFYAGDHDRSHALNTQALGIYRRLLGDAHPHVADSLINLGAIAFERGDDEESERLFREGLALTQAWYGPDHHRTANNLVMLGRTLTRRDKLDEASQVLARALAGRERTYGHEHPTVASVLNELGTVARKQLRLDEAESCYRRMDGIYRRVHAGPHFLVGVAASNLGTVAHLRGDHSGALDRLREAVAIFIATQGPDHPNTGIARVKLGMTLLASGAAQEALDESRAGYDVLQLTMSPGASWIKDAERTIDAATRALGASDTTAQSPC